MSRVIKISLSISICLSMVVSMLVFAADCQKETINNAGNVFNDDVYISEVLTYDEMIQRYADNADISFGESLKYFPETHNVSPEATYRELQVTLDVDTNYKPKLSFYCETSQYSPFPYWGIVSIYSVQLIRNYDGISKQFNGNVDAWLRTASQIEYVINGDFYDNGTTTDGFPVGRKGKINDKITCTFTTSFLTNPKNFKYFYEHIFYNFQ